MIDLSTLLSQDLIDKLHQVEVLTKYDLKNIEMFISSLFEILHFHEQNPYFYTIIAVILFFSNNLIENFPENFELPTELAISYFHPKIFDASISIFNEKVDFSIFNTFRSIFSILLEMPLINSVMSISTSILQFLFVFACDSMI